MIDSSVIIMPSDVHVATHEEREIQRLMRIKRKHKRKFKRYMSWRWEKLDESWRYPRGRDNKARLQLKGKPPIVKIGYRSPKLVRFLHPSLKREVLVYRVEDLFNIDPLNEVARISSNVGGRKRLEIIKFAEKFGIRVLNPGRIPEIIPAGVSVAPTEIERAEELTKEIEETVEGITPREEIEKALEEEIEKIEAEETPSEIEKEEEKVEIREEEMGKELEEELKKISEEIEEGE